MYSMPSGNACPPTNPMNPDPKMKCGISISIITLNEEANIQECLESIKWGDEIVVVDGGSSDRTVEIARTFTGSVLVNPWPGYAVQKQVALDHCHSEWVLSLDADERVTPELREEVMAVISHHTPYDGFFIGRRSYFMNKWIRYCGWYPGYQLRLFRKSKSRVSQSRVHEGFLVEGLVGILNHDIVHYSHPTLSDSIHKMNRYTSLEALDRIKRKKVFWYHFVFHPTSAFLFKYIRQKGYLDGMEGFLLCWISAFYKMVVYMKLWRLQRLPLDELSEIQRNTT
jgi:glycosyltransferase involved in cell wall biosynthesis